MGRGLIKIKDLYFEWSTIVDAPVTWGMTEEELREWTKENLGAEGLRELPERIERVGRKGTSYQGPYNLEDVISGNRAGPQETELSMDEIYIRYRKPSVVLKNQRSKSLDSR
jgi:hypothetical protein